MAAKTRDPESIERIRKSVATVPWPRLAHAYHGASDAPAQLEIFLNSTASTEALKGSVEWLWASVLHQGTVYSASTPILWILIDLLIAWPEHPAAASILRGVQTIAAAIPHVDDAYDAQCGTPRERNEPGAPMYETWVSDAVPTDSDEAVDSKEYFTATTVTKRQLQALVLHSLPAIEASLRHPDATTRIAAVAAALGALPLLPGDVSLPEELANVVGNPDFDPGTWISTAMILGARGRDYSDLLGHGDRRLRLAAAMSPATTHDARGIAELAAALSEPEWLESAFPNGAAHLDFHLRFHVLAALLDRTKPHTADDTVIAALCTLLRKRAGKYTADMEWGPVLHWAFPERIVPLPHKGEFAPLPESLTPPQKAILRELCAKPLLWDRTNGNAGLAFKRIQLPFDRESLQRLAGESRQPGLLEWFRRK